MRFSSRHWADLNLNVIFLPSRTSMRNAGLIWLMVLLWGCQQDELAPCLEDGPEGKLCREYRYFNDDPVGYVEFGHFGDSLLVSSIYNNSHRLQKTTKQWYLNNRISVIAEQYPDQETRVQTWHYNDLDSLSAIVHGANDSSLVVNYENGKRQRESYWVDDSLIFYFEYRYFQDDGKLYRIYRYVGNDSLTGYRNFEYFSTGQNRVSYYTAANELIGRRVFRFSQNGLINSMEFTAADGTVTERTEYFYDAAGNLTEKTELRSGTLQKSIYLYH